MKIISIITIVLFSTIQIYAQQAWTQPQGEGYFQIGSSHFTYSSLFDDSAKELLIPRPITESVFSFYGEYGITDRWMATVNIPFHKVSSGKLTPEWKGISTTQGKLFNLGTISSAMTYRIVQKQGITISGKITSEYNSAKQDTVTGLRTGIDAVGFTPTVLFGIGKEKYFMSAETGVGIYNNDLSRYLLNAQIGKKILESKKMMIILALNINTPIGEKSDIVREIKNGNAKWTGLYLDQRAYYALNIKLGYDISPVWSMWLSIGSGPGKNIGRAPVFSFSLGHKLIQK